MWTKQTFLSWAPRQPNTSGGKGGVLGARYTHCAAGVTNTSLIHKQLLVPWAYGPSCEWWQSSDTRTKLYCNISGLDSCQNMYKAYKTFAPQLLKSQCSVNSQLPKYFSTIVTLQPTDCGWDICIGFHYCQHHVAHCQDLSKLLQALSSLFSSLSSATSHMPFKFYISKIC